MSLFSIIGIMLGVLPIAGVTILYQKLSSCYILNNSNKDLNHNDWKWKCHFRENVASLKFYIYKYK